MAIQTEFVIKIRQQDPRNISASIIRTDTYEGDIEAFPEGTTHKSKAEYKGFLCSEDTEELLALLNTFCPEGTD